MDEKEEEVKSEISDNDSGSKYKSSAYLNSYIQKYADMIMNSSIYNNTHTTMTSTSSPGGSPPLSKPKYAKIKVDVDFEGDYDKIAKEAKEAHTTKVALEQYKILKDLAYIIDSDPNKLNMDSLSIAINLTLLNSISELKELMSFFNNNRYSQTMYPTDIYGSPYDVKYTYSGNPTPNEFKSMMETAIKDEHGL